MCDTDIPYLQMAQLHDTWDLPCDNWLPMHGLQWWSHWCPCLGLLHWPWYMDGHLCEKFIHSAFHNYHISWIKYNQFCHSCQIILILMINIRPYNIIFFHIFFCQFQFVINGTFGILASKRKDYCTVSYYACVVFARSAK